MLPWHRWGRQGRDLAHFSSTIANSICLNGIEVSRERPLFFSWGYQFLRRAMTTLFLVCARARMWVHIILLVVYCFVYVANLGQRSVCWPFIRVDNWPQYAFSLDEKDEGFFSYIIEGRSHTVIYIDRNNVGRSRTRLAPKSCSPWNFLLERVHLFFSWERCFTCKICGLTRRCLSTFMACDVGGFVIPHEPNVELPMEFQNIPACKVECWSPPVTKCTHTYADWHPVSSWCNVKEP